MPHFTYIYDTYCGWCYGAEPVITALIESGAAVEVFHRHLFQGANAHRMGDGFGRMAMQYDRRIATLSGQEFSDTYISNILSAPDEVLESGLTARAAALIHDRGAKAEMALAARLQRDRFVNGRSAADKAAVTATLAEAGVTADLADGAEKARAISEQAAALLARYGLSGVPALLRHDGDNTQIVNIGDFYQTPERIAAIAA
ncbi:DsbA family protein [uncultured Martelella sp.]|uniref:DsbA family protein n=1 Tax=uncultured Martelella sp. TaxID=392331 RepID=UPI0029C60A5B|nr:DsbA family protein [uncultured Martelella sp.]